MTIRIVFRCSRCGSKSFRPSSKWTLKDTILNKIGVVPQRCFSCRGRFYLFRPALLQSFLRALAAPPLQTEEARVSLSEALRKRPVTDVLVHPRRKIELSRLADTESREGRSQTPRENLAG
jgi:hypothetical protein